MSIPLKIAKKIDQAIKESHSVLLHLHPSPDGDSIGSALAFYHYLTSQGKKVTLIKGDSETPNVFSSFPGYKKIAYKNFFEINQNDFDLFIILDSSSPNQISKINNVTFEKNLNTIIIDHHATNDHYAKINLIDTTSPATCQIVYELFKKLKYKITPDIAICLMIGIYTDSGGFKYPTTTYKTFTCAAELAKINPHYHDLIFHLENNDTPDRLILTGIMLCSIKTYFHNSVAIASVGNQQLQDNKIDPEVSSNLNVANMLKAVVGWEIGITMIEGVDGKVKISLRTRDSSKYNLGKIAQATGYGGGHAPAAGASIPLPLNKAIDLLLKTIHDLYPDLGNP